MSTETIYRSLFVQARGVLRKELMAHLRTGAHAPVAQGGHKGRAAAASSTRSRSASARPRPRTAPSPATGRATCWPAPPTRTSPPWSSARRASFCWSRWPARTPRRSSPPWQRRCGAAPAAAPEPHLGPRHGARRAPALQRRHGRRGLLLRPAIALAAGHQREHQRAAAPVLPEEGQPVRLLPGELDVVAARLNGRPRKTLAFETPADRIAAVVASTT